MPNLAAGPKAKSVDRANQTRMLSRMGWLQRRKSSRSKSPLFDFLAFQKLNNLRQFPNMAAQAGGHRWRYAQALVNPSEVVMHEMHRAGEPVIVEFLAESIRQAGESSHLHPHREIVALRVRRANLRDIGQAHNDLTPCADAFGRRILSRLAFAVKLDQHPII